MSPRANMAFWLGLFGFVCLHCLCVAALVCRVAQSTRVSAVLNEPATLALDVALFAVGLLFYVDGLCGGSLRTFVIGFSGLLVSAWAIASRFDDPSAGVLSHLLVQGGAFLSVMVVVIVGSFVHETFKG